MVPQNKVYEEIRRYFKEVRTVTIRVCDRCGKKLSSDYLKTHPHYQIRKNTGSCGCFWETMWSDFCEDCTKKLEKWLSEGGKQQ